MSISFEANINLASWRNFGDILCTSNTMYVRVLILLPAITEMLISKNLQQNKANDLRVHQNIQFFF